MRHKTYKAFKFIRQAGMYIHRDYLDELELIEKAGDFYFNLDQKLDTDSPASRDLRLFFKEFFDPSYEPKDKAGSSGKKSGGRGSRSKAKWGGGFVRGKEGQFQEILDSPAGNNIEIISLHKPVDEEIEADLDDLENTPDEELILIDDDNKKSDRLFSNHQIKHLEMTNQHLPFDWSRNTTSEIAEIIKLFGDTARNSDDPVEKETACLCLIMLVTGESMENIRKYFRYINSRKNSRSPIQYNVDKFHGNAYWTIRPTLPEQTYGLDRKQYEFCEVNVKGGFMDLPDLLDIGSFLRRVFDSEILDQGLKKSPFRRKIQTYRKTLNSLVKTLDNESRINEHRIRSHLFNKIVSEVSGDIAEATLITGRYHPMAKTKLHYSAFKLSHLQQVYRDALESMAREVSDEAYDLPKAESAELDLESDEVIGTNFMPRFSAVKNAVHELSRQISHRPDKAMMREVINYHNAYTLYTVLMTGYCTGYRAVYDPFPSKIDVDTDDGLCLISDKDGADYYNSRIVWLPDMLINQLNHYQEHRQVAMNYLVNNRDNLSKLAELPNLFFLDEQLAVIRVRPSTLKPLLNDLLPLPINSNRRFLRTHLKRRGCSVEIINAFMGHWARGEEPWGRYSTLSYHQIVEELKNYLEPLVNELGFKPVRSRIYAL